MKLITFRCHKCHAFTKGEPHISTEAPNFVYAFCQECGAVNWRRKPKLWMQMARERLEEK